VKKSKINHNITSMNFTIKPISSKEVKKVKSTAISKDISFSESGNKFTALLLMLRKYMNEIRDVAEATTFTNMVSLPVLAKEILDRAEKAVDGEKPIAESILTLTYLNDKNKEETHEIKSKVYEHKHIEKLEDYNKYHNAALKILNETTVQQIVNSFEMLLADILSWQLTSNPDAAPKDQKLSFRELLTFSSFEEAKKHVIDQEISSFLKSKSIEEQLKYFKDEFSADIGSHFCKLSEFKEFIYRRHVIVHAGSVATAEYLRKMKSLNLKEYQKIKAGQVLKIETEYVKNAWDYTYSMGVILLHLVARNWARSNKNKDLEDKIDTFLLNASFSNIQEGQYKCAYNILHYAHKLTLSKQSTKLRIIINLAQTYLWLDQKEDCEKLLERFDWSSTSSIFRLCVSALLNKIDEFKVQLPLVIAQQEIGISELFEWPVFRKMRENTDFPKWVEKASGRPVGPLPQLYSPKLLDFKFKTSLEQFSDLF
jgi:hypothetical protein